VITIYDFIPADKLKAIEKYLQDHPRASACYFP